MGLKFFYSSAGATSENLKTCHWGRFQVCYKIVKLQIKWWLFCKCQLVFIYIHLVHFHFISLH